MAASGEHILQASDPAFQQFWINTALASGISRADIDAYIHENGAEDLPSIVSRLGPNPGPSSRPGGSTNSLSYSAAIQAADPYATPTPVQSGVGLITQASAADGRMVGAGSGREVVSQGAAAPVVNVSTGPGGIPTWALIAAGVLVVLLLSDRSG